MNRGRHGAQAACDEPDDLEADGVHAVFAEAERAEREKPRDSAKLKVLQLEKMLIP